MNFLITAPDGVVLRDGKPFGQPGNTGGGFFDWPMPQTITGMIRSSIGLSRHPDFFRNANNASKLLPISVGPSIPVEIVDNGKVNPLFPVPADLLMVDSSETGVIRIVPSEFKKLQRGEGTDSPITSPFIPVWETQQKPTREIPAWLCWNAFKSYCEESLSEEVKSNALGPSRPVISDTYHNAIDASTLAVREGFLFQTRSIYFKASTGEDLGIITRIRGEEASDSVPESAYLGGERRRVGIHPIDEVFPSCPNIFSNQRFLKIVLATHGDFGGWAPSWLLGSLSGEWVKIPNTSFEVRLRSALVPRWEAISGWDYALRKPKAMRKLVVPGAVYLIEIRSPESSSEIANTLWGAALESSQAARDGYGYCFVAKAYHATQTTLIE